MRKLRAASIVCAAVLGLWACDDNPVSDDRENAFMFFLNPSFVTLARDNNEKIITGYTVNRYGEPTYDDVTATACNNNIAMRTDSLLLPVQPKTRVRVRGVAAGASCIVFNGAGLSDTVRITVQ